MHNNHDDSRQRISYIISFYFSLNQRNIAVVKVYGEECQTQEDRPVRMKGM